MVILITVAAVQLLLLLFHCSEYLILSIKHILNCIKNATDSLHFNQWLQLF